MTIAEGRRHTKSDGGIEDGTEANGIGSACRGGGSTPPTAATEPDLCEGETQSGCEQQSSMAVSAIK
jgi:hypothetical protein